MSDCKLGGAHIGILRPMVEDDLKQVLEWRNHKNIRQYMYNKKIINIKEHKAWYFEKINQENQYLLIFELNNISLGFVSFSIKEGQLADWGFYTSPDAPKGTGFKLGETALNYVFDNLQCHKLSGEVLDFNEKSMRFHLKLGFTQEGISRDQFFNGVSYNSVIYFGLLKTDREENK